MENKPFFNALFNHYSRNDVPSFHPPNLKRRVETNPVGVATMSLVCHTL